MHNLLEGRHLLKNVAYLNVDIKYYAMNERQGAY